MYQNLTLFQTAGAMATHAGARQNVTARNIANADTPNYRAESLPAFAEVFEQASRVTPRKTRAGHLLSQTGMANFTPSVVRSEASPNGNTVSLEEQMVAAADAAREHEQALAIYRHGMTVLRTALGR